MKILPVNCEQIFGNEAFEAQREKQILFCHSNVSFLPTITIDKIWIAIRYNKILVNNLSMSINQTPIDKFEYSDGIFVEPSKVLHLYAKGATIVFRGAHIFFPEIYNLAATIQQNWRCEVQANIYISNSGADATYPHFDPHEIYIFQLFGSKKWEIFESKYIQPEFTDGYDTNRHGHGDKMGDLVLNAGDIAFLPRGTIHHPISITPSCHVALGVKPLSYSQIIKEIITIVSSSDVNFREMAFQGRTSDEVVHEINRLLTKLTYLTTKSLIEELMENRTSMLNLNEDLSTLFFK